MIVEFAGLPGAGKSTLYGKLARRLHKGGYVVNRFNSKARFEVMDQAEADAAFDASYPGLAQEIAALACEGSVELEHAPVARHVWMSGLKRRAGSDVSLLDEGFMHRCAYLAATGAGRGMYLNLLDRLPKPDLLVLVDLPAVIARDRAIERHERPRARRIAARRFDAWQSCRFPVGELLKDGRKHYSKLGVATARLDSSGSLESTLEMLESIVLPRLPAIGAPAARRPRVA